MSPVPSSELFHDPARTANGRCIDDLLGLLGNQCDAHDDPVCPDCRWICVVLT